MSSVFLAEKDSEPAVAIKLLNLSLEAEPEFRKRFQREAELTQRLDHPNIVKTYRWEDDPDVGVFLVMEYASGGNLRTHLEEREKPMLPEEILAIFEPVAQALDYAHAEGVIHRDIKPENLIFASPNVLKIADFGVARVEQGSRLTRTGVLPGTPEYMAPEQFSDQPAGPSADVYSLATIIYECLTGTTPFRSDNLAQVLQRQAFDRPQPPSQRDSKVPLSIDRVLLRALEKKPEQRYAKAGEFLAAFQKALTDGAASASGLRDLPTRQVNWKAEMAKSERQQPWILAWLIWTLAGLVWIVRWTPSAATPDWLEAPSGWQSVALGRQLCASVLWNGIEVALLAPTQQQKSLARARFAALQWSQWQRQKGVVISGRAQGDYYFVTAGQDWLAVDPAMAANLLATPKQIGEYWVALLQDIQKLRQGERPEQVRELERKRPLRLDRSPPRYPLLDKLYDSCRIEQREGPLSTEILLDGLESLPTEERRRLTQAARSVPLPKP